MNPQRLAELGLERLDLLCAFLHYELGETSLANAPVVLMGYRSVGRIPLFAGRQVALQNLRRCCSGLGTVASIRAAVVRYNDKVEAGASRGARFVISEKTLDFKPVYDLISDALRTAVRELHQPDEPRGHGYALARTHDSAYLRIAHDGEERRYAIEGLPKELPTPAKHRARTGTRTAALSIPWADLLQEAEQMDEIDRKLAVKRSGNWAARMQDIRLTAPGVDGKLLTEDDITLAGIKHLIGLPGAGKTTLLVCLLRYLGTRHIKTAVFFPSIEVCRQYLEDLQRYGVNVGLLVGQSADTKERHAFKLGESLATGDPLRGFGRSTPSAPLFEGVCALPRLTNAPAEVFSIDDQYCRDVLQAPEGLPGAKLTPHLCPAWSVCSRNRAARSLPNADVWLGHIRSADTRVPVHTSDFDERYFELIAREFDAVIFDEADSAQQALDMMGVSQLKLSGYRYSFHESLQNVSLRMIAAGANARLRDQSYAQFAIECAEFEKLNVTLMSAIHRLDEKLRRTLSGLLLTPLRVIGDWLTPTRQTALNPDAAYKDAQARAKEALSFVWEDAAISAFQARRSEARARERNTDKWRRIADALQRPMQEVANDADSLQAALAMWLNAGSQADRIEQENAIEGTLGPYLRSVDSARRTLLVRLLIAVTFTVLCYRRLSYRLNELSREGVIDAIRLDERCSEHLLTACPDNLLGSLSGVRFFVGDRADAKPGDEEGVQLQYVVFSGAPRAFMYRLHEWNTFHDTHAHAHAHAPAVLLTSATSFMPASPAFHIDVTPSYLLRRQAPYVSASASYYAFRPIPDPDVPDQAPLRYSGVRAEAVRMANLRKMVSALLEGGPIQSRVATDCAQFDVRHGIRRKAAFVVNSYDHCVALKRFIDQKFAHWGERTVAVVKEIPDDEVARGFVTASMVEALGDEDDWDLLIFPLGALGRGTNIVFSSGPRQRDATIGTLYFLTRPHPSPDDLGFLVSMGARATMRFDAAELGGIDRLDDCADELRRARGGLYRDVGHLLRHPLYARSLRRDLFTPFTANVAVPLLQTIGRAMRNGCPAQCFFVDRAWAENSGTGGTDNDSTSMLVQLRTILEEGCQSADPQEALLFRELYGPFLEPFQQMAGLSTGANSRGPDEDEAGLADVSPLWAAESPVNEEH
ncbi:hypothetical protein GCM10027321_28330 [Massilia terrae]|uniref:DNA helicase n=1 Tax=Massilia terrae TaxID=1811224 RepID=A0ABT2D0L1_9BURK|nr:hypothetical protein [Massilia terrae]MCS0659769.1 hypothetical protein [Massilia terrae]